MKKNIQFNIITIKSDNRVYSFNIGDIKVLKISTDAITINKVVLQRKDFNWSQWSGFAIQLSTIFKIDPWESK